MASPVTFISGGRGALRRIGMNTEQKKDPAFQQNQEDSLDTQGARTFTLSCLKEELGKMEGIEFVMFIPLGGEVYGR